MCNFLRHFTHDLECCARVTSNFVVVTINSRLLAPCRACRALNAVHAFDFRDKSAAKSGFT